MLSPNPSIGYFQSKLKISLQEYLLKLLILMEKKFFSKNDVNANEIKSIDLSNVQSGVYILKVNGQKLNYTEKIVNPSCSP